MKWSNKIKTQKIIIFYSLIKKDKEEQIENLQEGHSSIDEIEQQYVSIVVNTFFLR